MSAALPDPPQVGRDRWTRREMPRTSARPAARPVPLVEETLIDPRGPLREEREILRHPNLFQHLAALLALAFLATAVPSSAIAFPATPATEELPAFTAMGAAIAEKLRLTDLNLSDTQLDAFVAGLRTIAAHRDIAPLDPAAQQAFETLQQRIATLQAAHTTATDDRLQRYLKSAREGLGLQRTNSGLLYRFMKEGEGPRPQPQDMIVADIIVQAPDAKTDLPQLSGRNVRIKVSDLPPGVAEGVQMMTLGGNLLLVVPPDLSFGNGEWPSGLERGMPLVFRIDLHDILAANTAP